MGDESVIGVGRAAAELMIHVGHADMDGEFVFQFEKQAQQRDGVCTAGKGNGHAISRAKKGWW